EHCSQPIFALREVRARLVSTSRLGIDLPRFVAGRSPMSDADDQWDQIVTILHSALPEIDSALSQANVPISARSSKAFEIVRETMLETSNWRAFLVSEAHG